MQHETRDIFEYEDHRVFLKDVLVTRKARHGVGLKDLASDAGFRSPAALSMVIRGQRKLSADSADRLASAVGLGGKRKTYFCLLAKLGRAKSERETYLTREQILHVKGDRDQSPLALSQYRCLASWFYPALYVMVNLKNFRRDPEWIAKRLGRGLTARQVKTALGDMRDLGMIREENGRLIQAEGPLSTSEEIKHVAIRRYHEQMIGLSREALELPSETRELNGLTIDVPKEHLPELLARIRNFRKEINEHFSQFNGAEEVYQLNIQFFPLTLPVNNGEKK